jgi:hypothetical protein
MASFKTGESMQALIKTTIVAASFALISILNADAAPAPWKMISAKAPNAICLQQEARTRCQSQCCNWSPDERREICRCCE